MNEYYERDASAQSVDFEILRDMVNRRVPNPKHQETFARLLDGVEATDVSAVNVEHSILESRREAAGQELATVLLNGTSGAALDKAMEDYLSLRSQTVLEEEQASELLNAPSVGELFKGESADLIRLFPKSLNDRIGGGARRGHHIVVFARPEMGKTALVINLMAGFLRQNLRVLYVGNEEPIQDTVMRLVSRISGRRKDEVMANPDDAHDFAMRHGYGNLFIKRLSPGTVREIEDLVVEVKPDVLVVDQLRNVQVKEDNFTRQLERAAQAVRSICGRHKVLGVSVTQAGDSATGKMVLDQGDVDSSNTGIPAQADLMIGLSAGKNDEQAGRRVISLPKNKLSGQHDFFAVGFDPTLSRFTSLE